MDDVGEGTQSDSRDHRQRDLVDHIARMTGDDCRAEYPVRPLLDVDLHEAHFLVVGDRAVHVVHRDGEGLHRDVPLARLPHIKPDMSDCRIGVGAPRNRQCTQTLTAEEQRILNHDARRRVGGMGELVLQAGIAGGIDAPVAAAQEIIDPDAGDSVEIDARGFQIQAVDIRYPACADQNGIDRYRDAVVVADQIDELLPAFHAHVDGSGVQAHLDAVARKCIREELCGVALFLGQEQRLFLRNNGLRSEAAERLRQFAAERAAADDQQAARQLGQVEDVLVSQIVGLRRGREYRLCSAVRP